LYKTNRQLSLTKKLFIYLSIIDMLTTCIGVICITLVLYTENICHVTFAVTLITNLLIFLSLELFLHITVLRYLSITRPFLRIKQSHQKGILLLEVIGACSFCTAYFFITKSVPLKRTPLIQFTIVVIFLTWIATDLTINVLSYKAMRQMSRKRNNKETKKTNEIGMKTHDYSRRIHVFQNTSSNNSDQRKKAVVTLIIITVSYLVCNLPITAYTLISAISSYNESEISITAMNPIILTMLMHCIQLTNGGLNAIIYILRSKEIRGFYKSKFIKLYTHFFISTQ